MPHDKVPAKNLGDRKGPHPLRQQVAAPLVSVFRLFGDRFKLRGEDLDACSVRLGRPRGGRCGGLDLALPLGLGILRCSST